MLPFNCLTSAENQSQNQQQLKKTMVSNKPKTFVVFEILRKETQFRISS